MAKAFGGFKPREGLTEMGSEGTSQGRRSEQPFGSAGRFRPSGHFLIPVFVRQWCRIQFSPAQTPLQKMSIQNCDEAFIMTSLDKMGEFVGNDVFQALHGLLCQLQINPNPVRFGITGTPLRFHLFDSVMGNG
jgi:hypothetical protein